MLKGGLVAICPICCLPDLQVTLVHSPAAMQTSLPGHLKQLLKLSVLLSWLVEGHCQRHLQPCITTVAIMPMASQACLV